MPDMKNQIIEPPGQAPVLTENAIAVLNDRYLIKDENGRVMPYTAGPFQTGGAEKPIRPGASVVLFASLDIAKQYDIKKPGRYQVQFSGRGLVVSDAIGSRYCAARRQFPSNTLEIEVKP